MQWCFFADIVVFLEVGVGAVLQEYFDEIEVLGHNSDMEGGASIDISAVDLGLLV